MASKVETLLSASHSLPPSLSLRSAAYFLATHPLLAVAGLVGFWLAYQLLKAAYNVSPLHPLSRIPGPWLAAATYWPEFYHDVILFGRYTRQIEKMHQKYGPIVRISPHEIHCNDIAFVDEIYPSGNRKRDKPLHQVNSTAIRQSHHGTVDHDLHRARRAPIAKFFSRGNVSRLEADVHACSQQLCDKLLRQSHSAPKSPSGTGSGQEPIDVAVAYSCFSTDAISGYCFGESFGLLAQEGWRPNFRDPTVAVLKPLFVFRFFPFVKSLVVLGEWFINYLPADTAMLVRYLKVDIPSRLERTRAELEAGIQREQLGIFGALLQSELEADEKRSQRLEEEAAALVSAGTETTAWALAVATYHLLANPDVLSRVTKELEAVVEDPLRIPAWNTLEKLPYFSAVVQEGLRLAYGGSARNARVPTQEDLVYRGEWEGNPVELVIPRGYAIGMSAVLAHHDEKVYPNSQTFAPERWLDEGTRKQLDRGLFVFSKGSRACPGMNLALCEMYLGLAALILRVFPRMRLFETTEEDILYDHDMVVPVPKAGTKGVRVVID